MTRIFALTLAIAVFFITPAYAAWVLWRWERHAELSESSGEVTNVMEWWELETATESLAACKAEMTKAIKERVATWQLLMQMRPKEVFVNVIEAGYSVIAPKKGVLVEYKCLPDTIDPRQ